jgi:dihydropteroate synthase
VSDMDEHAPSHRSYLRPCGLVPANAASRTVSPDDGGYPGTLPLCGDGPFDFTAIELIVRNGPAVSRRLRPLSDLWDSDVNPALLPVHTILDRLTSPRRRIAGLRMDRPQLMGIVNVTPDSFSDGGQFTSSAQAIEHALQLAADGAAILDIGGESTRPGSEAIALNEELARVLPVIEALSERTEALISIDTRKAEVARQALAAGAHIINDITAMTYDPAMVEVAADAGVPVVLMHALGDPKTMQSDPRYDDAPTDIYDYLAGRITALTDAGVLRERIIVDPGIGFGKTAAHNLQLMGSLALFHGLGCPVLLGASRKRFIGGLMNEPEAARRMPGSIGAALAGAAQGVQIIRVHDVRETKAALDVYRACLTGG